MLPQQSNTYSVPIVRPVKLLEAAIPTTALGVIAALLIYFFETPIAWQGTLGQWAVPIGIVSGVCLYGLILGLTRTVLASNRAIIELTELLHQLFRNLSWFGVFLLSALAGVSEELLFRVLIQTHAIEWFGAVAGIVLASVLFGFAHYLAKIYVVLTFLIGIVFGVLYYFTQSTLLIMSMHFAYDVCAFAAIVKFPHWLKVNR